VRTAGLFISLFFTFLSIYLDFDPSFLCLTLSLEIISK